LFVVKVIVTVLPASAGAGVYVNENGDEVTFEGDTEPAPSSVMATAVALPPKVLPLTVIGLVPHAVPLRLSSVTEGLFTHPHDTEKGSPVVIQPAEFLTVMV
jgi:hypothetical protein